MTLEEKLVNFKDCAIQDANMKSQAIIRQSEEIIKNNLAEYEEKIRAEYDNKIKIETDMIIGENNQDITREKLAIKQRVEQHRLLLIDKLFLELRSKLIEFKREDRYRDVLIKQINTVKEYVGEEEFVVYVDKTDKNLAKDIEDELGVTIKVSDSRILGGIRAVVKSRQIMIDYSFITRLKEERANFTF